MGGRIWPELGHPKAGRRKSFDLASQIDNLLLKCYYTANQKDNIGSTQMITGGTMMKTSYQNLITIEPGKRGGRACIRGMRMTVSDVLSYLAAGMTRQEVLDDFPYLTEEDIQACLNYAANREHQTWMIMA